METDQGSGDGVSEESQEYILNCMFKAFSGETEKERNEGYVGLYLSLIKLLRQIEEKIDKLSPSVEAGGYP